MRFFFSPNKHLSKGIIYEQWGLCDGAGCGGDLWHSRWVLITPRGEMHF